MSKWFHFLPVAGFLLAAPLLAAEQPSATGQDFSTFKTADDLWKQIEKLQQPPEDKPSSRDEALKQLTNWLGAQKAAADAFVKSYPDDARRWQARLIAWRADRQLQRYGGQGFDPVADRAKLDEIINAADAPQPIKGEASFYKVMTFAVAIDQKNPESYAPFYKAAEDFLQKFPDHPLAVRMKAVEVRFLGEDSSKESEALLKKMAAGSDKEVAGQAQSALAKRQKSLDLKSKPVPLKFTSADGHPIDLADYRGKVVLVDFWASWCGPCMGEMPNVVSTYGKLHEKGFEILGISLDQDKEAMEGALKHQKMTWPQYFDGQGWQNKISSEFGIQSIPAAWLIDKKGMLREQGLRGEALGEAVQKLLAE